MPFELTSMEGSYKGGSFRESKEDLSTRKGTLGFWPASKRDRKKGKESCIFQSQLGRPSRSSWKLTGPILSGGSGKQNHSACL